MLYTELTGCIDLWLERTWHTIKKHYLRANIEAIRTCPCSRKGAKDSYR